MESKYLTIYNEISNKIENNKIQSGEKLSSENEMNERI